MSDRASGHSSGATLARRAALLLGFLVLAAGPAASAVGAAGGLTVTTPFPAVVVDPGSTASFTLTINVPSAERVDLSTTGLPSGWTARFKGGGLIVDGVFVDPKAVADKTAPSLTLDIQVPDGTAPGTNTVNVNASGSGQSDSLALAIRVNDASTGSVSITSDFPQLSGPSSSSFSFNLTLHNDTAAESTFSIESIGPDGWTVTAKPSSQAQATSVSVAAGSSTGILVSATPGQAASAGTFPIDVTATSGGKTAKVELNVVITGSYSMTVSTPNQVLSTTANAGSQQDFQITFTNTGTAPVTNLTPSASAPTSWKVTFDKATIASIDPGKTETVTAQITPTGDAIAGDYTITMTGTAKEASANATIRVTVQTPTFWWIVGIVLIGATFVGLYWVFRTYGRR
jgi:uncharacterized membrane protein